MSDLLKVRVGGSSYLCKWEARGGEDYDYSTTEKKIGTWIDGSDIYRIVAYAQYADSDWSRWGKIVDKGDIKYVVKLTIFSSIDDSAPIYEKRVMNRINGSYIECYRIKLKVGDTVIIEYTKN